MRHIVRWRGRSGRPIMSVTVYLGLGSNMGDRAASIAAAAERIALAAPLRDTLLSPLYETDAVAPEPQPPYLNAVLRGVTDAEASDLLARCLRAEGALGRVRPAGVSKAPRRIDIDLLLYGDAVIEAGPALVVPHPALLERPFVLIPLADVAAPGLVHPVSRRSLAVARPNPGVRRLR